MRTPNHVRPVAQTRRFVSHKQALDMIDRAIEATKLNDPVIRKSVVDKLSKEPYKASVGTTLGYDPTVRSSTGARGLYQFFSPAWTDARRFLASLGVSIPMYNVGVDDDYASTLACVAYTELNRRYLAARGIPVNLETLYLTYNQGYAFWHGKVSHYSAQSPIGRAMIDRWRRA